MLVNLKDAQNAIAAGELVAIPTETVYGLAARIDFPKSIENIFKVKERPFFDPLIVHVSNIEMAKTLSIGWNEIAQVLANKFWPGPLTLVLPKSNEVSSVITSGLQSVGIRWPRHPVTQKLIESLNIPLAAPSANKFGRTSPTMAVHVETEFKAQNIKVLDGGECEVGLESTVLLIKESELSILRAGAVRRSEIELALNAAGEKFHFVVAVSKAESPGHMKHHYMPDVPLVLLTKDFTDTELRKIISERFEEIPDEVEGVKIRKPKAIGKFANLNLSKDPALAARELYSQLRICSNTGAEIIRFQIQDFHIGEEWEAVFDRIEKAASLKL